ncbi:MAG: tetratricopeptide repeat protein, partial [Proteobacteria bacterium]|nr:tetratricopeptide repeat protein [Pseudomonadota bacterium]
ALADLLLAAKKYEEAITYYKKLLVLVKAHRTMAAQTLYQIGYSYHMLGKPEVAIKTLEQAIRADEKQGDALNLLAYLYVQTDGEFGRAGKFVEPVFRPLGWDWKVSAAVIAGFPAREVVIAVLGTVYAVGDEADAATLSQRLQSTTWPDGSPVFTLPMVFGLLIFYACCLQCAATLAVIRRETNSWRWPIFAWTYMTSIGYVGALLIYQLF